MQSVFTGPVYVVRDNIDTDQIIPAQYLNLVPTIPEEYGGSGLSMSAAAAIMEEIQASGCNGAGCSYRRTKRAGYVGRTSPL